MKKSIIFALLFVLFVAVVSPAFAEEAYTVPQSYYNSQNPSAVSTPTPTPVPAEATSTPAPAESAASTVTTVPTESAPVQVTVPAKVVYKENTKGEDGTENKDGGFFIESPDGKTSAKINGNTGYDGGFFIKSDDGKFKLKINGNAQLIYEGAIMEHVGNAHGGKPGLGIKFSGNAFTEKLTYKIGINPLSSSASNVKIDLGKELSDDELFEKLISAGPIANGFDVAYTFGPAFVIHLQRSGVFTDDAGADFLMDSFGGGRYPAAVLNLAVTGTVKRFIYFAAIFQKHDSSWYLPNVNNEMGYAARVDYNILAGTETRPSLDAALAGNLYHEETGTEARVIQSAANLRLGYKQFSFGIEGTWRQIDPDQFTLAQSDAAVVAWAGYYLVPQKLQFAIRTSHTFDDLTDSGTYTDSLDTGLNGNVYSPTLHPEVIVGDAGGDIANEWEASAQVAYWPLGSPNLALVAQYMFVNDNRTTGADSVQSHIIDFKAYLGF